MSIPDSVEETGVKDLAARLGLPVDKVRERVESALAKLKKIERQQLVDALAQKYWDARKAAVK